jgi:hypothetical protein
MTPVEFEAFRDQLIVDYAADHARAGTWTAEEAQARATADIDRSLPEGPDTAEELVLTAYDDQGPVGILWLSLKHPRGVADTAWIRSSRSAGGRDSAACFSLPPRRRSAVTISPHWG